MRFLWGCPSGSELYADAAFFTCYWIEDARCVSSMALTCRWCYAQQCPGAEQRPEIESFKALMRRVIESTFSSPSSLLVHHVHAATFAGFQDQAPPFPSWLHPQQSLLQLTGNSG
jgi:hypothetical protein